MEDLNSYMQYMNMIKLSYLIVADTWSWKRKTKAISDHILNMYTHYVTISIGAIDDVSINDRRQYGNTPMKYVPYCAPKEADISMA